MKYLIPLLLMTLFLLFIQCGTDFLEEGKQAYQNGDYNIALENLLTAHSQGLTDQSIDELIALSYMYRGQELFEKTKNVKSFNGNYESALKYIPEEPSTDFIEQYDDLLVKMAQAYRAVKPGSKLEKEQFYTKSVTAIKQALVYDSTNVLAKEIYSQIKMENFQELLNRAQALFNKAKKTRDWDLLFTAESYLNDAAEYDVNDPEVKKLRKKIKRETLGVLNYRDGLSLAITDRLYEKGKMIMLFAVKNYTNKPLNLDPNQLILVDTKGTKYPIDAEEMRVRELFGQSILKSKQLDVENPYTEGVIAFDISKNLQISYIALVKNDEEIAKKYFQ